RKAVLPMACLSLGAVLEGRHDYQIIDGNLVPDAVEALDQAVRETNSCVLGVTVMGGPQLEHAVPVCRALKRRHPNLVIVWGGYFPTQHYETVLRADYVDYVLRGHAELPFVTFLDRFYAGEDVHGVDALAYVDASGVIRANPMAPLPSPEDLPDFPYDRVDMDRYMRPTFMGRRTISHHSSYGCPFHCNFCAVVNMVNGGWKAQSAERTANVVRRLVTQYGADAVEFYDNNFFVSERRVRSFSEQILDLGIQWWGEARVDTMLKYKDETWALMRDSGLRMVFLGAESGSDETLRRMNKGGRATASKTLDIAAKMHDYGIVPEMSFVLGNPPDPERDAEETMAFIREVKRVNPATEVIFYMYTPVPLSGTLFDEAKANGFAFPETLEGWISQEWKDFSQRRSAAVPGVEDHLRRRISEFEQVLNAYYPTRTDRQLRGPKRWALRAMSGWRYHTGIYRHPIELKVFHKLFRYRRPETAGF
ncbi:MAG: radical SAM protein, partial [Bacteroidota bacterium]